MTCGQPNMASLAPPEGLQGTRKLGAIRAKRREFLLGCLWGRPPVGLGWKGLQEVSHLGFFYSSLFPGEHFTLVGTPRSLLLHLESKFSTPVSWIWARVGVAGFCPSSLVYSSKLSCVLSGWDNPPRRAEEPKGGGSKVRGTRLDVTSAFMLGPAPPPNQPPSCCFPGLSSTSK